MGLCISLIVFLFFTSLTLTIVSLRLKGKLEQANLNKPNFLKLLKQSDFVGPTEALVIILDSNSTYVGKASGLISSEVYRLNYQLGYKMLPLPDYEKEVFMKVRLKLKAATNFQQELAQLEASSELSATLKELDAELGLKS